MKWYYPCRREDGSVSPLGGFDGYGQALAARTAHQSFRPQDELGEPFQAADGYLSSLAPVVIAREARPGGEHLIWSDGTESLIS